MASAVAGLLRRIGTPRRVNLAVFRASPLVVANLLNVAAVFGRTCAWVEGARLKAGAAEACGSVAIWGTEHRAGKKIGRNGGRPFRPELLQAGDVRCLQALGAGGNFEFNRLAFVQRFVPFRLNRGKVDEDVLAGLALDEAEALAGIEPLYCSLFFHGISFLLS